MRGFFTIVLMLSLSGLYDLYNDTQVSLLIVGVFCCFFLLHSMIAWPWQVGLPILILVGFFATLKYDVFPQVGMGLLTAALVGAAAFVWKHRRKKR